MSALVPVQIAANATPRGNATRATRGGCGGFESDQSAGAGRGDVESAAAPALRCAMRGQRDRKHVVSRRRCSRCTALRSAQQHTAALVPIPSFVSPSKPARESMST